MEEGGPAGVDSTLTFENSDNMVELPIINYDQKQVWNYQPRHRWTSGSGLNPRVLFVNLSRFCFLFFKSLAYLSKIKSDYAWSISLQKLFLKIICSNSKIGIEFASIAFKRKITVFDCFVR